MTLDRPIEPAAPAAAPTREALTFEQWHAQWMALPIRGRGDGWKIKFNISSEIGDACRAAFNAGRSTEAAPAEPAEVPGFQQRVQPWMMACFGPEISSDRVERNHRFLEEALELVQATGCTEDEAHQLVRYVYARPVGEASQEVGGVMVTLAALCLAQDFDMHAAGETELARIWTKVDVIRAKQAAKPKHSPLPAEAPETLTAEQIDEQFRVACRAQGWSDFERSGGIYCLAGVQLRWEMFEAGRALATPPTALQEGAETLSARKALTELVACKDLKNSLDTHPRLIAKSDAEYYPLYEAWSARRDDYNRRQPLAWEAARRALQEGSAARSPTQEPPK